MTSAARLGSIKLTIVSALIAVAAIAAGFPPGEASAQGIKALVNDEPISSYDIDQRMRFLAVTTRQQPSEQLKKEALEMLVDERLQIQEGKKLNVTADESQISEAVANMAQRNNMDEAKLAAAFSQVGVNIATLKSRIRAQLVWQQVVRQKFRYEAMVAQTEIERASQSTSSGGAQLELHQVRLSVPSNGGDAAVAQRLAEAEQLRANFKSCASIGSVASSISGATVRNLGAKSAAEMGQPARTLLMNAKVGQMTPPNVAGDAIELYAVCGKKSVAENSESQKEAAQKAIQDEFEIRAKRLLRDLRQDADVAVRLQSSFDSRRMPKLPSYSICCRVSGRRNGVHSAWKTL
jgi:peptidyl-prolyl cis-trans isomerase SurA